MLDRLPPELLLRILDLDNFRSSASSSPCRVDRERAHVDALRACTLVCKKTSSVARPEVWREVSTDKSYKQYLHLERMCSVPSSASIAQLVRVLEWYPSAPMRLIEPRSDRLLPVLSNLRELRVFGESVFLEPDMLPNLERVVVNNAPVKDDRERLAQGLRILLGNGRDSGRDIYPDLECLSTPGGSPVRSLNSPLCKHKSMMHKLCFSMRHGRPLALTFSTSPVNASCLFEHCGGTAEAPLSGPISRTLVCARSQTSSTYPHFASAHVEIQLASHVLRESSSSLPADERDLLPCLETIFLPAQFRRLDPSTLSTSAQQARDDFFAQCEKHKVQVCYLSDVGKSEWPE